MNTAVSAVSAALGQTVKENILEFPNRSIIAEEAGAWLVKLDGDQSLSAEQQSALREWLQHSGSTVATVIGDLQPFQINQSAWLTGVRIMNNKYQ